ncbi:hypothetical protein [Paludibacterium sp. B53371]|uniref:hypothetical protein n=1 Tax=Paludibacterium sp. B53371 TaxID=2806263 RepID=UPI001C058A5B|nr:hypothetical protein [Paludibacterium sp. B53371]
MHDLHTALLQRIAFEVGDIFTVKLEDRLTAAFKASNDYANQWFDPELRQSNKGHNQSVHILQEVVRVAREAGHDATMAPTTPKGHHYAKVILPSFTMGGTRIESPHWQRAKYAKNFGRLNKALEPLTRDLFDAIEEGVIQDRIFLVVAVAENRYRGGFPDIYFAVPYSTLDGYHFSATLDEVREATKQSVEEPLEPLVFLKKRLDDAERGAKEA